MRAILWPGIRRRGLTATALFIHFALIAPSPLTAATRPADTTGCVTAAEAAEHPNREVCVSAHIYDVVELSDGTRFLDVCPAATADNDCHFVIMSLPEDRSEVGPLNQYRNMDVHVRGVIRPMNGRMGLVLSHVRQFSGGHEKFKPNPKLIRGFTSETDHMPVADPNLRGSGHGRSFMNNRDKSTNTTKSTH